MPNPVSDRMEKMSAAYVSALCAANGYTFSIVPSDYEGIDCIIDCPGYPSEDDDCKDYSPSLRAQLKSTYSRTQYTILDNGDIRYKLKVGNYNSLVIANRSTPSILILFIMPELESAWLEHTIDYLKIRKCAYWISLKGRGHSDNTSTVTIDIPHTNALSADELKRIMIKVSKEESL